MLEVIGEGFESGGGSVRGIVMYLFQFQLRCSVCNYIQQHVGSQQLAQFFFPIFMRKKNKPSVQRKFNSGEV